VNLQTKRQMCK